MSMKLNLVGNPVGLPKVFNQDDANKQTVMLITVAVDRNFKSKDSDEYGVDYVQVRAFPRSDKHGSFIWNTIKNALDRKQKVAMTATRQQNVYEKNGETVYEYTNRLEDLNLTGALNTVTAIGRLSRDAQFFDNVALVTLAVEQDYIKKGESAPAVDHIQAKLFLRSEAQTGTMKKHLVKGALAEINGAVRSSVYEKDGENNYAEEIVIDRINPFLAGKPKAAQADVQASAPVEAPAQADPSANPFA